MICSEVLDACAVILVLSTCSHLLHACFGDGVMDMLVAVFSVAECEAHHCSIRQFFDDKYRFKLAQAISCLQFTTREYSLRPVWCSLLQTWDLSFLLKWIEVHAADAAAMGKPLIVEEFGKQVRYL